MHLFGRCQVCQFVGSLSMIRFSSSVNAMGKSNDLEKGDSKGKSYDINSCIQSSSAKYIMIFIPFLILAFYPPFSSFIRS